MDVITLNSREPKQVDGRGVMGVGQKWGVLTSLHAHHYMRTAYSPLSMAIFW